MTADRYSLTVSRNFGAARCFVACSYAYARPINVISLKFLPKNDTPTGNPNAKPAGTVMCG